MRKEFIWALASIMPLMLAMGGASYAAAPILPEQKLTTCLAKANALPDMAKADADKWFKAGGGEPALICRATAEFHAGDFAKSAQEFSVLGRDQRDPRRASLYYEQAGLAYSRVTDFSQADQAFTAALKYENQDPDLWCDRATARAGAQHYWEAIEDLNHALTIMPDMPEALRLRGQAWYKLGLPKNAEEDFGKVAEIQAQEDVENARLRKASTKKSP